MCWRVVRRGRVATVVVVVVGVGLDVGAGVGVGAGEAVGAGLVVGVAVELGSGDGVADGSGLGDSLGAGSVAATCAGCRTTMPPRATTVARPRAWSAWLNRKMLLSARTRRS